MRKKTALRTPQQRETSVRKPGGLIDRGENAQDSATAKSALTNRSHRTSSMPRSGCHAAGLPHINACAIGCDPCGITAQVYPPITRPRLPRPCTAAPLLLRGEQLLVGRVVPQRPERRVEVHHAAARIPLRER